jgi:hypothetical protein
MIKNVNFKILSLTSGRVYNLFIKTDNLLIFNPKLEVFIGFMNAFTENYKELNCYQLKKSLLINQNIYRITLQTLLPAH